MIKRKRRVYIKRAQAGITTDMWHMLQEMKIYLHKSKASIIRDALTEYYERHVQP